MTKLTIDNVAFEGTAQELITVLTAMKNVPKYDGKRYGVLVKRGDCLNGFNVGEVVEITSFTKGSTVPYHVKGLTGYRIGWARTTEIKVVEAERPVNVVGKHAVVIDVSNAMCGFELGDVVQVIADDKREDMPYQIRNITNGYNKGTVGWANKEDIKFTGGGF